MSLTKPPFCFFGRLRSLPNLTRIPTHQKFRPTKATAFPWRIHGTIVYLPTFLLMFMVNVGIIYHHNSWGFYQSIREFFFSSGGFGTTCTHSLKYLIFRIQGDDWKKIPTNWSHKNQSNVGKYTSRIGHTWIVGVPCLKKQWRRFRFTTPSNFAFVSVFGLLGKSNSRSNVLKKFGLEDCGAIFGGCEAKLHSWPIYPQGR